MQWAAKLYKFFLKLENALLILFLLSIIVLAVVQIVMRNFFDAGLFWAESYLRTSVLWIALLGAMIGSRNGEHLSIDFFVHKLTEKSRTVIQRLTDLFTALLCFGMTYYSSLFLYSEYQDGSKAFAVVPNWLCEIIIPITFAVIAGRYLVAALFNLRQENWL
jgi:TRAP-type C4-dicarboxylate transport system permease small subunit